MAQTSPLKSKMSDCLQRGLAFSATWGRNHGARGRVVLTFVLRNHDWAQCFRPIVLVTNRAVAKDHKFQTNHSDLVRLCFKIYSKCELEAWLRENVLVGHSVQSLVHRDYKAGTKFWGRLMWTGYQGNLFQLANLQTYLLASYESS